ncbi:unnamed protein product [Somion occarium]|uniref:Uncharacterized protein n=1 Tax=Somion occarium TaxID=3059160 RepID=A0ABP1EAF3_9APHY
MNKVCQTKTKRTAPFILCTCVFESDVYIRFVGGRDSHVSREAWKKQKMRAKAGTKLCERVSSRKLSRGTVMQCRTLTKRQTEVSV